MCTRDKTIEIFWESKSKEKHWKYLFRPILLVSFFFYDTWHIILFQQNNMSTDFVFLKIDQ